MFVLLALPTLSWGQGCVCQRQNVGGYAAENAYLAKGDWIFSGVFQNSVSNRHYQGTDFISSLSDRGPDNVQNLFNLNVTRAFTNRLSIGLDVPISTTSYTLNRVPPGSPAGTSPVKDAVGASGLGDITVRASYWLKSTGQAKQNLAIGVGLEAPTGSADVRDTIYGRVVPVDVSTQLGAKAWAPSLSARGFRTFGYVTAYGSSTLR